MQSSKVKFITCSICGFVFETPITTKEFEGCYTPPYCEQKYLEEWAREYIANAMGHTQPN